MAMLLEGKNAVIEALRAGMPVRRIMIAEGVKPDTGLAEIERRAGQGKVSIDRVPRRELDRMSEHGAHQGVIAEAAQFKFAELTQVLRACEDRSSALIIVLDHVTDPGNLGAIVRTAEVVGAAGVVVPSRRSAALTPAAWKAAAGALAHVPLVQETNVARALKQLKDTRFWVAGASERAEQNLWSAPLEGRIALVMGSEGEGLARLTRETCDFLVRLPQVGKIGSLNVAQATTALAYEWMRRNSEGE